MDYYLCQYCLALTNQSVEGDCADSPTHEHEWLSGEEVAGQVRMIWEMPPEVIAAAGEKSDVTVSH